MGADLGPAEVVEAVKLALADPGCDPITLVGDRAVLEPLVARAGLAGQDRVAIVHASEVITMDDKPVHAIKKKKDSSMVRAIELVKTDEARVVISCGNTGALAAASTIRLRMVPGIDRPALGAVIPRHNGFFILIDAGANPESKAENLVHNAILGSNYARVISGVESPRVGLITIGTEEGKGNALVNETNELLKKVGHVINYIGPIEGFGVFTQDLVDVVVCDGFVGNILLKTWESMATFIKTMLKEEMTANPLRMAGGALARGAFDTLKMRMNPERYGGAPLLGVNGAILKAHGSSNRHAIASAIRAGGKIIRYDLRRRIEEDMNRLHPVAAAPHAVPSDPA